MKTMRAFLTVTMAFCAAQAFHGCVDTTPLDFVESPPEGGLEDGSIADGLLASCRECVTAPDGACHTELELCDSLPKCRALAECLLDDGCLSLPALEERIECGTTCLEELEISGGTDPAIEGVLQVNACSLSGCRSACLAE